MTAAPLSTARVLRGAAVAFFVLLLLWKTLSVDLLAFAGIILAVFLHKTVEIVARLTRLAHHLAFALVFGLIACGFVAICWFFAQSLIGQFQQLGHLIQDAIPKLQQQFPVLWSRFFSHAADSGAISSAFEGLFGVFSSLAFVAGAIIIVVFFALYLAAESGLYIRGAMHLVPPAQRVEARALLGELGTTLWYWMLGRLFSMTVIGIATFVGLSLLGIPLPVALGLLSAGLALIPYLGAIASAVPSLLLAFTLGPRHALYVLVLYVGIHILEGYVLIPMVQRRASHVPPALTLAGQLIMGVLAGLLGLLLAMPLTAILIPTVRRLYVGNLLGDRDGR